MRLIDGDALVEVFEKKQISSYGTQSDIFQECKFDVYDAPEINYMKCAHWIERQSERQSTVWQLYCSKCNGHFLGKSNYCPSCGAKMTGDVQYVACRQE